MYLALQIVLGASRTTSCYEGICQEAWGTRTYMPLWLLVPILDPHSYVKHRRLRYRSSEWAYRNGMEALGFVCNLTSHARVLFTCHSVRFLPLALTSTTQRVGSLVCYAGSGYCRIRPAIWYRYLGC